MPGMKKEYDRIWRPKSKASEGPKKSMPRKPGMTKGKSGPARQRPGVSGRKPGGPASKRPMPSRRPRPMNRKPGMR